MAYTVPAPELAKMVMSTCSLTLNGPGFKQNSHLVPLKKALFVILEAMSCPSGTTAIWAEMDVMESGSLRYQKNWFRNERRTHDKIPRTHIRNVKTGRVGSSVVGTVRATCSTGEFSSGSTSSTSGLLDFDNSLASCDEDEDGLLLMSLPLASSLDTELLPTTTQKLIKKLKRTFIYHVCLYA